jgi:hypothetical protein
MFSLSGPEFKPHYHQIKKRKRKRKEKDKCVFISSPRIRRLVDHSQFFALNIYVKQQQGLK